MISSAQGKKWLSGVLQSKFEIKSTILGHDGWDAKSANILNIIITVVDDGYEFEADIRHAELVVKELGLENSKSVSTPWADQAIDSESEKPLEYDRFKKYQSVSARINFLALDRMDIQFSAK